jgi:hypothetical protein
MLVLTIGASLLGFGCAPLPEPDPSLRQTTGNLYIVLQDSTTGKIWRPTDVALARSGAPSEIDWKHRGEGALFRRLPPGDSFVRISSFMPDSSVGPNDVAGHELRLTTRCIAHVRAGSSDTLVIRAGPATSSLLQY